MRALFLVRALVAVLVGAAPFAAHAQESAAPQAAAAPQSQSDREIQLAEGAFAKDARLPSWVQPLALADSRTTGAAVVALSDTQIRVGDETTTYVRRAIKINNTAALTPFGRVPLPFIPAYQKVVLHTLQVVRDGVVLDRLAGAQVRFLQRETGLEHNLYSGVVTASILVDDLRVGDTIEIAYSAIGTNPVFGHRFSGMEQWDQGLPTDERRVIVNAPVDRRVRWKFHGDLSTKFPQPTESVHDGVRSLTFDERGLIGTPNEPLTPPGFSTYRWLQLSEYADWPAVSSWAASLFDVHEPPNAERAQLVATLSALPTVEARVVGALEFVQSQIRYFSVSIGTSSHQPTAPNTVIARRYGDCKDKSLLLMTLLADMGIPSTAVLARLNNRTGFDDWLPTPLAFDHVIVAVDVDGARYWLDSTRLGQHGRLARMGQAHDGAEVLPATTQDGRLVRIAVADRDALDLNEISESVTVDRLDGDGVLRVVQTLNGVAAETVRANVGSQSKERIDENLGNEMQKRYPKAKVVESMKLDDDRLENRITIRAGFALEKPIAHADGRYRFAFRPDNFARVFTLPPDAVRRAPVQLRYPVNVVYHFDGVFPADVAVVESHASTPLENRYFRSSAVRAFAGNHSEVTLRLQTLADRVAAADLQTLRDDIRKMDLTFPAAVTIAEADVKRPGFLGLGRRDFATTLKERQDGTVQKVSTAIASGRLSGEDLARAYCTRGLAYAALGRRDEALKDADEAVGVDTNSPTFLECRAALRLRFARFDEAIDDASQSIVLGNDGAAPYQTRGEARYYLGRYAAAADDFAKAAVLDRDEQARVHHDVWRAMAYRRMKKPLPDDLRKRADDAPGGAWPRPALALFADRMTPEQVTAVAAGRPGDEAAMAGTEADFFIGEFYLASDDPTRARDAFTAARARGVIVYTEYGGATIELDRLPGAAR